MIPTAPTSPTPTPTTPKRGAFILLEGVDRCGKTTQCQLLLNRLLAAGLAAAAMRFPDRTTATGSVINQYLQQSTDVDDRSIHLLFAANRWEAASALTRHLSAGTTVVCDRYAYSGVAFSAAKVVSSTNNKPLLDLEWCQAPDRGLPAPDCVIFLDLSQNEAEKRGGCVLRFFLCYCIFSSPVFSCVYASLY
jgi:dTMP kinase